MRIVFLSDWFAEKMGYAENCLPRAVAALGHETHVVSANVQPYFDSPSYKDTYEPFIGPAVVPCEVKTIHGFTLHRLPHARLLGRLRMMGLVGRLARLKPHIVQAFEVAALSTYEAAFARPVLGYKLFLESHIHASVFRVESNGHAPRQRRWAFLAARYLGRLASTAAEKCYAISSDVAEIAVKNLGVSRRQVQVCSLGVDTQLFRPPDDPTAVERRAQLREQLGLAPSDIVCVYTGRFSADKDPLCLAQAIDRLAAEGLPFRGLFVGSGTPAEVSAIQACRGCVVHPFVPVAELPALYWAADVAVWPKQESTSQLDAAACGLPLVLSDQIHVRERVDGNGFLFREGDPADLADRLRQMADPDLRRRLGAVGREKMQQRFSWLAIARQRLDDYEAALGR